MLRVSSDMCLVAVQERGKCASPVVRVLKLSREWKGERVESVREASEK